MVQHIGGCLLIVTLLLTAVACDGTETDGDSGADADTDVDTDVDGDSDTDVDADTDTDVDGDSDTDTDAGGDVDAHIDGDTDADFGSDASFDADSETETTDDPYDPVSCRGAAWTRDDALAFLDGAERVVLDGATIQRAWRSCDDTCGPWTSPSDWTISYLEYSGGVTTRYVDVPATMNLVLFNDSGTPRLSMQHTTFGAGGYDDDMGMVYDFPPSVITFPHVRAHNVTATGYDYEDLDYQVKAGVLELGEGCARWTAHVFGASEPYSTQYAALFRW